MTLLIALAASLLAVAAMAFMSRAEAAVAAAEARAAGAEAARLEADRLSARIRALQREVETLSAIREVALIANDDVSFERILAEVLKVVEDLLEAREISIWLAEEQTGALAARAVRRAGVTHFATSTSTSTSTTTFEEDEAPERGLVDEAYRLRRTLRRVEGAELVVATLLYADAEVGGVLCARAGRAGRTSARSAARDQAGGSLRSPAPPGPHDPRAVSTGVGPELDDLERALEALAKHVALAIKKPTLYDRAVIDSLTRLHTKRHFAGQIARFCAQSRRSGAPFALVICDIDRFKSVNDTHGHLTGDVVLAAVAATIATTIREADAAFRYGGEEMIVLAPDADLEAGRKLAERLRAAIEATPLRTAKGDPMRVTASFGVAVFGPGATLPDAIVAAADKALYRAKETGRNRVCTAGETAAAA